MSEPKSTLADRLKSEDGSEPVRRPVQPTIAFCVFDVVDVAPGESVALKLRTAYMLKARMFCFSAACRDALSIEGPLTIVDALSGPNISVALFDEGILHKSEYDKLLAKGAIEKDGVRVRSIPASLIDRVELTIPTAHATSTLTLMVKNSSRETVKATVGVHGLTIT